MKDINVISDFELAKLMMDPKRSRILAAAADEPVTVKQIAEKVGEVPSRLYYHVKKLEEAGILLTVETKQQGNLIERYYRTNVDRQTSFKLDDRMASENSAFIIQRLYSLVQSGLALLQKNLESGEGPSPVQADVNISYSRKTHDEWLKSQDKIIRAISNKPAAEHVEQQPVTAGEKAQEKASTADDATKQDASLKEEYVYVMLTYRLSDAEPLMNEQEQNGE